MNHFADGVKKSFLIVLLLGLLVAHAQHIASSRDSLPAKRPAIHWRKVVLMPSVLIGAGLLSTTDNEVFDKFEIHEERQKDFPGFRTHIDDYLQYAPIAAVYGLNLAGIKGEHDFVNRTVLMMKSEIIMMAMVIPLKKWTAVPRPDTGSKNSFPSGHTAQAFAAATFLHKEYGKDHPLYSVLAYSAATGVGVLRVMNNRHWVSDVLAGAGIGILATNLAYATHRNKWGSHTKKGREVVIAPTYSQQSMGMYLLVKM